MNSSKKKRKNRFTTIDYWNSFYKDNDLFGRTKDIVAFLSGYIPNGENKSCFEIGCFPGGYLDFFAGQKKYTIYGIDFCSRMPILKRKLQRKYSSFGNLWEEDFFRFAADENNNQEFDVVCSFGFIEHFENTEQLIEMHSKYVSKNGYLIITAPNFYRGSWNFILKKLIDKKNLMIHNVSAIDVEKWENEIRRLGYNIEFCGYFGGLGTCWGEYSKDLSGHIREFIMTIQGLLRKIVKKDNYRYSKFCGVIAKKVM